MCTSVLTYGIRQVPAGPGLRVHRLPGFPISHQRIRYPTVVPMADFAYDASLSRLQDCEMQVSEVGEGGLSDERDNFRVRVWHVDSFQPFPKGLLSHFSV